MAFVKFKIKFCLEFDKLLIIVVVILTIAATFREKVIPKAMQASLISALALPLAPHIALDTLRLPIPKARSASSRARAALDNPVTTCRV